LAGGGLQEQAGASDVGVEEGAGGGGGGGVVGGGGVDDYLGVDFV
jgi:hypothetical protein